MTSVCTLRIVSRWPPSCWYKEISSQLCICLQRELSRDRAGKSADNLLRWTKDAPQKAVCRIINRLVCIARKANPQQNKTSSWVICVLRATMAIIKTSSRAELLIQFTPGQACLTTITHTDTWTSLMIRISARMKKRALRWILGDFYLTRRRILRSMNNHSWRPLSIITKDRPLNSLNKMQMEIRLFAIFRTVTCRFSSISLTVTETISYLITSSRATCLTRKICKTISMAISTTETFKQFIHNLSTRDSNWASLNTTSSSKNFSQNNKTLDSRNSTKMVYYQWSSLRYTQMTTQTWVNKIFLLIKWCCMECMFTARTTTTLTISSTQATTIKTIVKIRILITKMRIPKTVKCIQLLMWRSKDSTSNIKSSLKILIELT